MLICLDDGGSGEIAIGQILGCKLCERTCKVSALCSHWTLQFFVQKTCIDIIAANGFLVSNRNSFILFICVKNTAQ